MNRCMAAHWIAVVSASFGGCTEFFESTGAVATYTGSWCAPRMETSWNGDWQIMTEQGTVTMAHEKIQVEYWTGVDGFNDVYDPVAEVPHVAMERQAQAYLLHEFVDAVTNGTMPATSAQDNIHSLRTVFDAVASFESGQVVAPS